MSGIMEKFEWVTKQYIGKGEYGDWKVLEELINDLQKEFKQNMFVEDWGFYNEVEPGEHMDEITTIYNAESDKILSVHYGNFGIRMIDIYDDVVKEMIQSVACPLCGDGEMEYEPMPNPKGMSTYYNEPASHAWICDSCPAVLVEWHDHTDDEALSNRLNGRK